MNDRVELPVEMGLEIMAPPFRFRPIDHADGAFDQRAGQRLAGVAADVAEIDPETRQIRRVKKFLVTSGHSRTNSFPPGGGIPVVGRGYGSPAGGESEKKRLFAEFLADELADVELAALAHLGCARVTQMRVMRPNHDLASATVEMSQERLDRSRHVFVPQVPGRSASPEHRAIIAFRIRN